MTARALGACLLATTLAVVGAPLASADAPSAGVTVVGNELWKDGQPFLPRGFNMIGLLAPDWCTKTAGVTARAHFGPAELDAATAWHANTLRFQVSQRGLADPAVAQSDRDAYLQKIRDGVALARANGFVVILSMQDQATGCGSIHPLPSQQTADAWAVLAPVFADDPSVVFELFNEPRNNADAAGWAQWQYGGSTPDPNLGDVAIGHQQLVDELRALNIPNLLVADVARLGEQSAGLPLLSDPNLAYGIHPYAFTKGPTYWDQQYGGLAAASPVIATEWNYLADGCGTAKEQLAPSLLAYLRSHDIGVLGHAFDAPGTTVADFTWAPTACGTAVGGSGAVLKSQFAAQADAENPPTTPTGLQAAVSAVGVDLSWDASTDDVGVAGYDVLRDGVVVARSVGTTYSDTGVAPSTTYLYTVRAVDAGGGMSAGSPAVSATTPDIPPDTAPPTAPAQLSARLVSPSQAALSWSAATDDVGVVSYQVLRDGAQVAAVTGTSWNDTGAPAGPHTYAVRAEDAANNESALSPPATVTVPPAAHRGLTGTYFDTATLTTRKLVRVDPTVNFSWGAGSPSSLVGPDTFSARWTGEVIVPAAGPWTFVTQSDNGVRLWIDGATIPLIDNWVSHPLTTNQGTVFLSSDRAHVIRLEYFEQTGSATMKLLWSGPGVAQQVIPAAQLLSR